MGLARTVLAGRLRTRGGRSRARRCTRTHPSRPTCRARRGVPPRRAPTRSRGARRRIDRSRRGRVRGRSSSSSTSNGTREGQRASSTMRCSALPARSVARRAEVRLPRARPRRAPRRRRARDHLVVRRAASAAPPPASDASRPSSTHSRTVSESKRAGRWNVRPRPARARAAAPSRETSRPWSFTLPPAGCSRPEHALNVVLFPDPLGPISPVTRPVGAARLRRSTARMPPYRTVRSAISMPGRPAPAAARGRAGRVAEATDAVRSGIGAPIGPRRRDAGAHGTQTTARAPGTDVDSTLVTTADHREHAEHDRGPQSRRVEGQPLRRHEVVRHRRRQRVPGVADPQHEQHRDDRERLGRREDRRGREVHHRGVERAGDSPRGTPSIAKTISRGMFTVVPWVCSASGESAMPRSSRPSRLRLSIPISSIVKTTRERSSRRPRPTPRTTASARRSVSTRRTSNRFCRTGLGG